MKLIQINKSLTHESNVNLPNILTILRIASIPLVVYFTLNPQNTKHLIWGASIFGLSLWTDFFDGMLARKMKKITLLGRILDPMADKLMIATGIVMVVHLGFLHAGLAVALLCRELAVDALRSFAAIQGIVIASSMSARIKVFAEGFGVGFLMLGPNVHWLSISWMDLGWWVYLSGLVLAYYSGAVYFVKLFKEIQSHT